MTPPSRPAGLLWDVMERAAAGHSGTALPLQFSHVLIDEAGQATEPEALIPLTFLQPGGTAMLCGDPRYALSGHLSNFSIINFLYNRQNILITIDTNTSEST